MGPLHWSQGGLSSCKDNSKQQQQGDSKQAEIKHACELQQDCVRGN
jgi:hypothetical protein